jgi:hypothetical protein
MNTNHMNLTIQYIYYRTAGADICSIECLTFMKLKLLSHNVQFEVINSTYKVYFFLLILFRIYICKKYLIVVSVG